MIKFETPNGSIIDEPNANDLRKNMIDNFPDYWHQGTGAAAISRFDNEKCKQELLILPSDEYGIYLKYLIVKNGRVVDEWLSLEDPSRLDTCAECSYEWYASVGLFLPIEKAWITINEFLISGNRSNQIDWIKPEEMPDDGNW